LSLCVNEELRGEAGGGASEREESKVAEEIGGDQGGACDGVLAKRWNEGAGEGDGWGGNESAAGSQITRASVAFAPPSPSFPVFPPTTPASPPHNFPSTAAITAGESPAYSYALLLPLHRLSALNEPSSSFARVFQPLSRVFPPFFETAGFEAVLVC
jgi:hypothetical protein